MLSKDCVLKRFTFRGGKLRLSKYRTDANQWVVFYALKQETFADEYQTINKLYHILALAVIY